MNMETAVPEGQGGSATYSAQTRERVGMELQDMLVELIDLSLVAKQMHWSVVGTNFRSLHLELDEFAESCRRLADVVAERAVTIGYWPDGQGRAVTETNEAFGMEALPPGAIADREVVELLNSRLNEVIARTRGRTKGVGDADIASQDVLIDVVRALEQHEWMLRSQNPR